MKLRVILLTVVAFTVSACSSFYSQRSEIKQGDGTVFECNGQGSCYKVK